VLHVYSAVADILVIILYLLFCLLPKLSSAILGFVWTIICNIYTVTMQVLAVYLINPVSAMSLCLLTISDHGAWMKILASSNVIRVS